MIILIKDIPRNTETSKLTYSILYLMVFFFGFIFVCFFYRFNDIPGVFCGGFFFTPLLIVHVKTQFQNASIYISTVTL